MTTTGKKEYLQHDETIRETMDRCKEEIIAAIREIRQLLQAGRLQNRKKTFQTVENYDN